MSKHFELLRKMSNEQTWPSAQRGIGTCESIEGQFFGIGAGLPTFVLLMATVNFISHGRQDMYPTCLQQLGFNPARTSDFTAFSMFGALLGGLTI